MARDFLSDYTNPSEWENVLQELAKMDFNMVQFTHRKEILQVSKWWKDTGLASELKFARDQPLKWYMWPMAALTDPRFSEQRVELTKPISFIYLIDDIFDVYGTLEELTLFTEVVNRWELGAVEQLPEYMKICFKALDDITNHIAYKVYREHGWNPIDSLRRTWASLCNAFLVEAKWFDSGHLPKPEEYLKNGVISSGVHVVLVHTFFLLGHNITKQNVNLVNDNPGIVTSTATILRLFDDLGSAKDENQDGKDGSYVQCYMKENNCSSVDAARKQVIHMISEAWKSLNKECLSPNPFSPTFTKGSLNIARMVPLMYSYDDKQNLPVLEEYMKSMFYHAYDNYMTYAFPHDELKPLAKTFTDSLVKLGNLKILARTFATTVSLICPHTCRIAIQSNIRVLGGLVSAHILASDSLNRFLPASLHQLITESHEKQRHKMAPRWFNIKCTMVPGIKTGRRKRATSGNVLSTSEACAQEIGTPMTFSDETQPPDDTQTVVEETQPGKTRSTRVRGRTLGKGVQKKIARKKGEKLHVYVNRALEAQLDDSTKHSVSGAKPVDDVGVEDFLDPQLLFALKEIGFEDDSTVLKGPEKPEPIKSVADKGENSSREKIRLEAQIKAEKVKAINLKRAGKQAEALDALQCAKVLEKKLSSLAS
ncbi:hypothetical protein LOK49_LG09G01717 [Camellia lanceoleosa]|uniref:Uncharacterized protein n=1 Tax=Camellia lanceoleosa TaxID=1840588 RepID=A0ACC0GLJ8_9ERIC|nr:hypothetical protein LOK49_LG09G01717 [Camellia lanceoleosa]